MNKEKIQDEFNKLSLAPNFNRSELHHIVAYDNDDFDFVDWDYVTKPDEKKYLCVLVDKEYKIDGVDLVLKKSYELLETNIYEPISNSADLINAITSLGTKELSKYAREFSNDKFIFILDEIKIKFPGSKCHISLTMQEQVLVIEVDGIFVSITLSMVYISKRKDVFSLIKTL
jgi:hypothetical protein